MNTYKIIGLESFTAKSGNLVTKIHAVYQNNKISGLGCETFFIMQNDVPSDVTVDAKFKPLFGRQGDKGFLAGIQLLND